MILDGRREGKFTFPHRVAPTAWPCFYGVDTPQREKLLAATMIRRKKCPSHFKWSSLQVSSRLTGLYRAVGESKRGRNNKCPQGIAMRASRGLPCHPYGPDQSRVRDESKRRKCRLLRYISARAAQDQPLRPALLLYAPAPLGKSLPEPGKASLRRSVLPSSNDRAAFVKLNGLTTSRHQSAPRAHYGDDEKATPTPQKFLVCNAGSILAQACPDRYFWQSDRTARIDPDGRGDHRRHVERQDQRTESLQPSRRQRVLSQRGRYRDAKLPKGDPRAR